MAQKIKAVIWDLVGVLLREEDPAPRKKLAEEIGLEVKVMEDLVFSSQSAGLATEGTISEEAHWQWVARQIDIRSEALPEFQRRFWEGEGFDMQLADFIAHLKKDFKTSLLSNAWSGTRKLLVDNFGRLDIFNEVLISAEMKLAKPDPAIYQKMLKILEVLPEETIFLDDTLVNVAAASDLGIHAIQFHSTRQAIAEVSALVKC